MTIDQIRSAYPEQWILVGNPVLDDSDQVSSVLSKLRSGIVLYHSKDKREIAYKAKELTQSIDRFTCIFTGEVPKNRRFLLGVSLNSLWRMKIVSFGLMPSWTAPRYACLGVYARFDH